MCAAYDEVPQKASVFREGPAEEESDGHSQQPGLNRDIDVLFLGSFRIFLIASPLAGPSLGRAEQGRTAGGMGEGGEGGGMGGGG